MTATSLSKPVAPKRMAHSFERVVKALREHGLLEKIQEIALSNFATMHGLCESNLGSNVRAKHEAWWWQKQIGHSYTQIGEMWGYEYTSVINGVRSAQKRKVADGTAKEIKAKRKETRRRKK